ncbi:MAG: nitrogen-fixing NifU domain protein [Ignavibacteria bacterium]|nr:nitrogen-fixing NifU domain protein [Ignavibacteria bacterium]
MNSEDEISLSVNKILDISRPYLEQDGGGIEFVGYEEENQVAVLRFTGNCAICPLKLMTLRGGIERFILASEKRIRRIEIEP